MSTPEEPPEQNESPPDVEVEAEDVSIEVEESVSVKSEGGVLSVEETDRN